LEKQSRVERSKEHLIAVATKLFAEKGIRGVTVRDIAGEAGVSHSMIFRHFGGLEGLARAAFERVSGQVGQNSEYLEPLPDLARLQQLSDQLSEHDELARMLIHGLLEQDTTLQDPDHMAFKRLVSGIERKKAANGIPSEIDSQKLAVTSVALLLGWQLIESRIPDLMEEPDMDIQAYRHDLIKMWADVFAKAK